MKKQLNLICVLIFFFVGLSLVPSIYSMGNAFVDGFKEGMSQAEEAHEQGTTNISAGILSPMTLSLWPKSLAATSDKLFNQKDQEWYPASHIKTLVWAKSKDVGIARYVSFAFDNVLVWAPARLLFSKTHCAIARSCCVKSTS